MNTTLPLPLPMTLLDQLDWTTLPENEREPLPDERPYAIRTARLQLGPQTLRFYELNNGKRVINDDDLMAWFSVK